MVSSGHWLWTADRLALVLSFSFHCFDDHRDLHSFPTRRSSDLQGTAADKVLVMSISGVISEGKGGAVWDRDDDLEMTPEMRSEDHTSELQSLTNLVCRLLLEKKNTLENAIAQELLLLRPMRIHD